MNKKVKKVTVLTCDDCGETSERVFHTTCPYEKEINNTEVECNLCEDCEGLRSDEI